MLGNEDVAVDMSVSAFMELPLWEKTTENNEVYR